MKKHYWWLGGNDGVCAAKKTKPPKGVFEGPCLRCSSVGFWKKALCYGCQVKLLEDAKKRQQENFIRDHFQVVFVTGKGGAFKSRAARP